MTSRSWPHPRRRWLARPRPPGKDSGRTKPGYWYIHNAVDDCSRLGCSELPPTRGKETAAAFWERANAYFEAAGIVVKRVLTDNGACYRSNLFAAALGEAVIHKRTRPYRPQTNGKVERYNRTLLEEWAHAQPDGSESERAACIDDWLHTYDHHRGHTALKRKSPADIVPALRGQNTQSSDRPSLVLGDLVLPKRPAGRPSVAPRPG